MKQNLIIVYLLSIISGSCFALKFFYQQNIYWQDFALLLAILICLIALNYLNHQNYLKNLLKIPIFIALGFLFCMIYLFNHYNHQKIDGKLFVNVKGRVVDYQKSYNSVTKKTGQSIMLDELEITRRKHYKKKKFKKKRAPKITQKYILNNFQNVKNYPKIDEEYLENKAGYANPIWVTKNNQQFFKDPPKSVKIFVRGVRGGNPQELKIGDVIEIDAMLEPPKHKRYLKSFDHAFYLDGKSIGASGYSLSDPNVLVQSENSSFKIFFGNLRKIISSRIYSANTSKENKAVIDALLTGNKKGIEEKYYSQIKNSGLAHLFSISGLHLSLAAGVFFVIFRFLLVHWQYLAIHHDIKKISAVLSIISAFDYLNIANMPNSAVRSLIGIVFFMSAILIDRRTNPLRVATFAALIITMINPFYPFFIGFQLSFSSILGIIYAGNVTNKSFQDGYLKFIGQNPKLKLPKYFLQIILMSFAAQTTTAPFLIYHFGNFPIYGILANVAAIPIATLVTMPLGFLSFFLMIFGAENLALIPMSYSIEAIFFTAKYVANIDFSVIQIKPISSLSLILIIYASLIFVLTNSKMLKIILTLSLLLIPLIEKNQHQKPSILISSGAKYFAIHDEERGLVFSSKTRKSKQIDEWLEDFDQKERKYFNQKNCNKNNKIFCETEIEQGRILAIYKRMKISKICAKNYYMVINFTKKYHLPKCVFTQSEIVVDSRELLEKGNRYFYFNNPSNPAKHTRPQKEEEVRQPHTCRVNSCKEHRRHPAFLGFSH